MLRLDLFTDVGVFILVIDPEKYPTETTTLPTFEYLLPLIQLRIYAGKEFYGWPPYQNADTVPPSLISFGRDLKIKAFRLYENEFVGVESSIADEAQIPAAPYPFTVFGEYLGNKLNITGVAFKTPTTEYLLPVYVNDKPATEFMKPAPLSQQLQLAKEAEGLTPTEYLVVITDVWLDMQQAAEYLIAYVQDAEPQTKVAGAGKAIAWNGWNEK